MVGIPLGDFVGLVMLSEGDDLLGLCVGFLVEV